MNLKERVLDDYRRWWLVLGFSLAWCVVIYGVVYLVYKPHAPTPELFYIGNLTNVSLTLMPLLTSTTTSSTTTQLEATTTTTNTILSTTTQVVSTTEITLQTVPNPTLPGVVTWSGGDYYTAKKITIPFKYTMCNPNEHVEVPSDYVIGRNPINAELTNCTETNTTDEYNESVDFLNCTTYPLKDFNCVQMFNTSQLNCTETFVGTDQVLRYTINNETRTLHGGCIMLNQPITTSCCSCVNGGIPAAINAKYVQKFYEEVLNSCSGKPVVCPMAMRSPFGCHTTAACIDGRCQLSSR